MSINQAYGYAKTYEYLENEIKDEIPKEKTEQQQFLEQGFKEIENKKAIELNYHNALFKILTLEIKKEEVCIWIDSMMSCEKETLEQDIDEAIDKFKQIKEIFKQYKTIRRIK